jgi:sialic acid synthase SpsE
VKGIQGEETMQIGQRSVGDGQPTYIIAEIGSNHDYDLDRAKALIRDCAASGADAVKFQLFTGDGLVNPALRPDFHAVIARFALNRDWLPELKACADEAGVHFMATPFDRDAVARLEALGVPAYKIASSDLTNRALLAQCAAARRPILFSAGLAWLSEVEDAVRFLREQGAADIAVLHCIAEYPAPDASVNLSIIPFMRTLFGIPVGFSDHTLGIGAPVAAVALGACIIEKHVTHSKSADGPDHFFALEMREFAQMVALIRQAEAARGSVQRVLTEEELTDRSRARRGLFAPARIPAGTIITPDHVIPLRPDRGISAYDYHRVIGRRAVVEIEPYQPLHWGMFEDAE